MNKQLEFKLEKKMGFRNMQENLGNHTAFVENKIALTHVIFLWFYFMVSCNHVSIFFATNSYKTSF